MVVHVPPAKQDVVMDQLVEAPVDAPDEQPEPIWRSRKWRKGAKQRRRSVVSLGLLVGDDCWWLPVMVGSGCSGPWCAVAGSRGCVVDQERPAAVSFDTVVQMAEAVDAAVDNSKRVGLVAPESSKRCFSSRMLFACVSII